MSKGAFPFPHPRGRFESLDAECPGNTALANHLRIGENQPAIGGKSGSIPARGADRENLKKGRGSSLFGTPFPQSEVIS